MPTSMQESRNILAQVKTIIERFTTLQIYVGAYHERGHPAVADAARIAIDLEQLRGHIESECTDTHNPGLS